MRKLEALSRALSYLFVVFTFTVCSDAQGNFFGKTDKPLRYIPVGTDFVIENGKEFFNRPLYGGNSAFRVDAGDKPEFVLYLPGRGGNLRFGIRSKTGEKWLHDAQKITTTYRPGSMIYEIRDPVLGSGELKLEVLATYATEGLIVRALLQNVSNAELLWAYGGVNGQRGRRDGDIGTENLPMSVFFQFKPEFAKDNLFSIDGSNFTLESKASRIHGLMPSGADLSIGSGTDWADLAKLLSSDKSAKESPIIVGRSRLIAGRPSYLSLQRAAQPAKPVAVNVINESQQDIESSAKDLASLIKIDDLPRLFADAEKYRSSLASKVVVDTPDPFINAAAAALSVAGDSVWDENQSSFMHGAVAWRNKLLGWRGPYLGDVLGWHDRMRRHLEYWATRQNTSPIKEGPPMPDFSVNLARNEPELHTNGDISNSHYDMNVVYIDAVFRHILWTGDVEFARKMFPIIERHLAWERRLFRREFGLEKLPLYEAYVVIWASDDLQYNGGGVTHASAYNYYHNKMAARVAAMIGADGSSYEREAGLIQKAMRQNLWLSDKGWYGEYKDLLGLQRVHENAALWTFYHTVDSEAVTPAEAWQMSRFVDTQIPHIPIRGERMPDGDHSTLSTTSWMPYTWSTNNVVIAEVMHTSLGFWQAGRGDEAFKLFKGTLLDTMFSGLCPGNVGMATKFDMARGESQRDFADGIAMTSRALIEGLFGVLPDGIKRELKIRPAFPSNWRHASLKHQDLDLTFKRGGLKDTYLIDARFATPMSLRLSIAAIRDRVDSVLVNGKQGKWRSDENSVGGPTIEIFAGTSPKYSVEIVWKGLPIQKVIVPQVVAGNAEFTVNFGRAALVGLSDPQNAIKTSKKSSGSLAATAGMNRGHRTVFGKIRQGEMVWQQPLPFEIRPAFEIRQDAVQETNSIKFLVRNNTARPIETETSLLVNGQLEKLRLNAPAFGESSSIEILSNALIPGSNRVDMDLGNGRTAAGIIQNWKILSATASKYETVDLSRSFNDEVTNIFKNKYLSPRSPYVSLAMPTGGIGSWVHFDEKFEVDDSGLRAESGKNDGRLLMPGGVPFKTAGVKGERNIAFTSQWDNYPREISADITGRASHIYLLMAGSTNQMQSRFVNGEVVVTYIDGTTERLTLENPINWWPIDQDYFIDDYAFRRPEPIPPRVDLKTGKFRIMDHSNFPTRGKKIPGGAATVLDMPLDKTKELQSLTVRTIANEVIIGLMSATLVR